MDLCCSWLPLDFCPSPWWHLPLEPSLQQLLSHLGFCLGPNCKGSLFAAWGCFLSLSSLYLFPFLVHCFLARKAQFKVMSEENEGQFKVVSELNMQQ